MKKISLKSILPLVAIVPLAATAQNPVIDFESAASHKGMSVYDTWVKSPFRTGALKGNVAVTPNPDRTSVDLSSGQPLNDSPTVLGAQRSRYGSNTFGVRVDLPYTFELVPDTKFVHVKVLKPTAGRVMLVGLGSRKERLQQNPFTEQFWVLSTTPVNPGQWCDAVFPVKGAGGIDIRSLVLVPDCESPHALTEDFLFYIDDIEVNGSPLSRTQSDQNYTINGNKKTTLLKHPSHFTSSVSLTGPDGDRQTIEVPQQTDRHLYFDKTSSVILARPGEILKPEIEFSGEKMNGYVYVDWNNDGIFTADITDNATPAAGAEIMAYSYIGGKNSHGEKRFDIYSMDIPGFRVPEKTPAGFYRIRFKTDRDQNAPGGNAAQSTRIEDLGGAIVDATLLVHGDNVEVNDFQLNGEVLGPNKEKLDSYAHPFGQPLKVYMNPEKGFHQGGMTIRCGFDLKNDEATDQVGNTRYKTLVATPDQVGKDGSFVIPAEFTKGNVYILGNMVESKKGKKK